MILNCGLKAYRVEVLKALKFMASCHRYVPVLADWNGFVVAELPVTHHARRYGKTKFGISRFFKRFSLTWLLLFSPQDILNAQCIFLDSLEPFPFW